MRKTIAALQVSVDGFIEGPNGELDWAMEDDENWFEDARELLDRVDACLLGRGMYPGYESYWLAVLSNPDAPLPFSGKKATKSEIAYARWADKTPHFVLSTTLNSVEWDTTRIIRNLDEIRKLKEQNGKGIYVVGGAKMVSSLINDGLIDELRLSVNPLILGGGKALFGDVKDRHRLRLIDTKTLPLGRVNLTYAA